MPPMRCILNPYREAGAFPQPSRESVRAFHRTLPGYAPTPLIRRPALARALGVGELYVKYEGERFGLQAFKGLGASWALHRLIAQRPDERMTVSTASEGNHGRGLAWAAKQMGIPAVIFLPAGAASERVENIRGEGARVVLVEGTYDDAVRRCAAESERQGYQVVSDIAYDGYVNEIPLWIAEGYSTLYQEADEQIAAAGWPVPNVVCIPGGVGALLQGGVEYYRRREPSPRIVCAEPAEGDCLAESIASPGGAPRPSRGSFRTAMACLNCAHVSLTAWPPIRRGVDCFVTLEDRYAEEAVRLLFRATGDDRAVAAGASGAASTAALLALMREPAFGAARESLGLGPGSAAMVLCTEGAIDRAAFRRTVGEE